jgi:homoserine kinase
VHNTGAAALAVAAFASGRLDLLAGATDDRLHEPYRAAAVYPELPIVVGAARAAGALGACMSGAGSTVIAFADDPDRAAAVGQAMADAAAGCGLTGRSVVVGSRTSGAHIIDRSRPRCRHFRGPAGSATSSSTGRAVGAEVSRAPGSVGR